jgi:hypothetical protein
MLLGSWLFPLENNKKNYILILIICQLYYWAETVARPVLGRHPGARAQNLTASSAASIAMHVMQMNYNGSSGTTTQE